MNIYAHIAKEEKQDIAGKFARFMEKLRSEVYLTREFEGVNKYV